MPGASGRCFEGGKGVKKERKKKSKAWSEDLPVRPFFLRGDVGHLTTVDCNGSLKRVLHPSCLKEVWTAVRPGKNKSKVEPKLAGARFRPPLL
jgi:hypothetical protein